MISSLLSGNNFASTVISLLLSLPIIMLSLSLHETAHGYVAWKCGDPTARNLGRLTLNPLKHLDPVGCLFMLIFGFGWAKPVPINSRYFRNPRKGMALTAAAGPLSNFLLGLVFAVLCGLIFGTVYRLQTEFLITFFYWMGQFCYLGAYANFILAAFNLIPIPPFDGSRIVTVLLPEKIYFGLMKYEQYIMYGLLIVLFISSRWFGFSPFSWVASNLSRWIIVKIETLLIA